MNRSISILVYSTQLMKMGGIESHLQEFSHWLSIRGAQIDLVVLNCDILPETEQFYRRTCRRFFGGKKRSTFSRLLWLLAIKLKLIGRRYDAIYTNGQGESIQVFAKLFSTSGKWVHHYHQSCEPEDQLTWGQTYRKSLTKADMLIACSNSIAEKLQVALGRAIEVFPCFSRQISIVNREYVPGSKLKLGYYGRLIPEKGIDVLCQFSEDSELSEIEFHIWGQGATYTTEFFSKFPNIYFHGPFSGEKELTVVINSLHAYLLISKNPEALPIVLLEVMSAGLPWFATDKGGIPDIFHDRNTTRIVPASLDYPEIKNELLDFIEGIRTGKADATALKEVYQSKFSHEILAENWLQIFSSSHHRA